jgi:hypothetical protein
MVAYDGRRVYALHKIVYARIAGDDVKRAGRLDVKVVECFIETTNKWRKQSNAATSNATRCNGE